MISHTWSSLDTLFYGVRFYHIPLSVIISDHSTFKDTEDFSFVSTGCAMLLFSVNPLTVFRSGKWAYTARGCKAAYSTTTFSWYKLWGYNGE
jgi:hypothetical protein